MQRFRKSLCGVALCAAGVAACGSTAKSATPAADAGSTTSAAPAGQTTGPTITISKDLRFSSIPVPAGATVTVRNESDAEHTVSADTAAGGFDLTMEPGKTMTFTAPTKAGKYGFHCNIHTFMKDTLEVT